jgi:hypothetical protein
MEIAHQDFKKAFNSLWDAVDDKKKCPLCGKLIQQGTRTTWGLEQHLLGYHKVTFDQWMEVSAKVTGRLPAPPREDEEEAGVMDGEGKKEIGMFAARQVGCL